MADETAGGAAGAGGEGTASSGAPGAAGGQGGAQGGAGGAAPDWHQQIPEAIRGAKTWEKFKDPGAVFQSYHALEAAQGRMVAIPGEGATPEQVAAYREKLGVPKDPAGYAAPEGGELDRARWDRWAGHAHKLGLTPAQLTGLATLEAEERAGAVDRARQVYQDGQAKLRAEWGEALYNRNVQLARQGLDRVADPELKAFLDESGVGDHPALLKAMAKVGEIFAEHRYITGTVNGGISPEAARERIAAIMKSPDYQEGHGSKRDALAEELSGLYKLLYGTADVGVGTAR